MERTPHHDGSPLYVSNAAPKLGEEVELRVRTPKGYGATSILVRIFQDGEPRHFDLKIVSATENEQWWSAKVAIINESSRYRFLLTGPKMYEWLNASGIHPNEVSSAQDFAIFAKPAYPKWISSSVFYQIFPDRFAASGKKYKLPKFYVPRKWSELPNGKDATTGVEYFGGDLDGVREQLDHLTDLGVNGIYFTPFFAARSTHRYDASSFDEVDPVLGGDEAMERLQKKAKRAGIRIMGDLTTNHCGAGHPWIRKALADKKSKERSFFYWDKSIEHGYEGWWGLASLPKLNYSSAELRRRMYEGKSSIVRTWVGPKKGMAGWRIDVGNMTGRFRGQDINQEVIRGIRKAMDEANPDAWLVAENADNFPNDLDGFGWHGTMNYNGFMRPVWGWLSKNPDTQGGFFGLPTDVPSFGGDALVQSMVQFNASIPWRALNASMILLDSHDTARFRNVVNGDRARHFAAMGLLMTYPGVPSIFAGDEIGIEGAWGEDARRTIPWDDKDSWDNTFLGLVTALVHLRRNCKALSEGGLRFVAAESDYIAYLRECKGESLLVVVNREVCNIAINLAPYDYRLDELIIGDGGEVGDTSHAAAIHFRPHSAGVHIWRLERD